MIRFAVVGYDHAHLPKYVPAIARHPRARLSAVAATGRNKELAKRDAKEHGAKYVESIDALPEVDAAYVGTPPDEHAEVVETLAERGIHVLLDKPIALDLADADRVIRAARKAGVRLMIPFNPRYQVPIMRLKSMLDGGELGDLKVLDTTEYGKLPRGIPGLDTEWFFDPARAGFGGFGDKGIHGVDAIRWLTGSEFRRVQANVTRSIHRDIAVDDVGTAVFEMRNGVIATLQAGWMNPRGNEAWGNVTYEALGTEGFARVDRSYQDLQVVDERGVERVPWLRIDVKLLVDEFVRAVEEKRDPSITGEDARAALAATLACYESAKTGEPVDVASKA